MTTIVKSTLRPGLLVSLSTRVTGNVRYAKQVIEDAHLTDAGAQKAKWETERLISDPVEHEAAGKARSKARQIITSVCAHSAFGLLCPESEADELESAVAVARRIADEFNATAKLSRLAVHVMTGRIAPDDVEAVKAINSEVRELMAEMEIGIERCDVKTIREAAARAKDLGAMLSQDAEAKVQISVEAATNNAKKLVKAGEQAAMEVDRGAIRKLEEMRTSFLDLDGTTGDDVQAPAEPARALDLEGPGFRCSCGQTFGSRDEVNAHAKEAGEGHEGAIIFSAEPARAVEME